MSYLNVFPGSQQRNWSKAEIFLFRFTAIFFLLHVFPFYPSYIKEIFSLNWSHDAIYNFFKASKFMPQFIATDSLPKWGWLSYANIYISFAVALIGAFVWGAIGKQKNEYNNLYYWVRVIVRFRLAFAIIVYGIIKLFPLQMPFPPLSNLVTNYGDQLPWKIYWNSLGSVPWYESFFGFCEIAMGVLLFFRKTATFGAGITTGFLANVYAANIGYDLGEHVYSLVLLLMAVYLFAFDVPRLWSLLAKEKYTVANRLVPQFSPQLLKSRLVLKAVFFIAVIFISATAFINAQKHPYMLPKTTGLKGSYGYYNVKSFALNNDTLPYTNSDPRRWQDVIFEKWATISIKTARPVKFDLNLGDENISTGQDIDRNFESAGIGSRLFYSYKIDSVNSTLVFQNKNKNYLSDTFSLHYQFNADSSLVLSGKDAQGNNIFAHLEKLNKKFFIIEGRRHPIKL